MSARLAKPAPATRTCLEEGRLGGRVGQWPKTSQTAAMVQSRVARLMLTLISAR